MQNRLIYATLVLCLAAAGCGPAADDQANRDPEAQASKTPAATFGSAGKKSEGEIAFLQCAACHAVTADTASKTGPSLLNIYNQPAGQVDGYEYSEAMTASKVAWDRKNLSGFLNDPNTVIPGTKMIFAGIEDEAERTVIIDYLEELSADNP